jgi:ferredoxin
MPVVKFTNEKKEIEVPVGANLRKEAIKAGINLYPHVHRLVNCHGLAQCGSCRVRVTKGMENTGPMGVCEKIKFKVPVPEPMAALAYLGNEETMRLACCCEVNGDIEVETQPPMDLFGENFFS